MILRLLRCLGFCRRPALARRTDGATQSPWSGEWYRLVVEPDELGGSVHVVLIAREHADLAAANKAEWRECVRAESEVVWDAMVRGLRWADRQVKSVQCARQFGWLPGRNE